MNRCVKWQVLWILLMGVLIIAGCGDGRQHNETEVANIDDGHEGHNHGPGEHKYDDVAAPLTDDGLADWCAEHAVPESECTLCNPGLIKGFKESGDWCAGHGIPESHCRLCNPEIRFPQEDLLRENTSELTDWCAEHAVPESECTLCNPDLIAGFKESGDWCAGHGIPESHCRLCNPEIRFPQEDFLTGITPELAETEIDIQLNFRPNATSCATDGAIIQFASSSTAERAGINVESVQAGRYESIIEAPAEIVFDETEATVVVSVIPALVSRWLVSPGDMVQAGDKLALLKSPDIAGLKSNLVASRARYEVEQKELDRHMEMRQRNLISEADLDLQSASVEEARAEYTGIRGMLMSAGLTESGIEDIENSRNFSNEFVLHSPANGILVRRIAQLGELTDAGSAFAIVADPSSMWIEARLTEKQMKEVRIGDQLSFSSDGDKLNKVGGEIIWISRFLDPHTRTGTVRAAVLDRNHRLFAGEFGRARILRIENNDISLVPKDAVQWEGCCNVVFVMESESRYRPRKVQLFDGDGPYYQVADGVWPGEMVVVSGAFLLKTELKKSSIGAGCCGLEPVG